MRGIKGYRIDVFCNTHMLLGQQIMPCSCQWKKSFSDQLSLLENTVLLIISMHGVALQRHFYIQCLEHFGMPLCRWRSENRNICILLVDWLWNSFLPQFFRAPIHWPECVPGAGVNHCSFAALHELRISSFVSGDGLSEEASSFHVRLMGFVSVL